MARLHSVWMPCFVLVFAGCTTSSAPISTTPAAGQRTAAATPSDEGFSATGSTASGSKDLLDIPIMTEVDGIAIPREKSSSRALELTASIPADVGNEHAARNPKPRATGDWLTIRFESEPKNLNPM